MSISVNTVRFETKLRDLARVMNKTIPEAVKEEARLTAERIYKLTPPKNAKQGKDKVKADINRVYLSPSWFLETFSFRNPKIDKAVKEDVRTKDEVGLSAFFRNSTKLSKLHIESFSESIINRLRTDGAVSNKITPFSFPLKDSAMIKQYMKKKQAMVGLAKSGWAMCARALGGKTANWLIKSGSGSVKMLDHGFKIVMKNHIGYFRRLDSKNGILSTALAGRKRDIATRLNREIKARVSRL